MTICLAYWVFLSLIALVYPKASSYVNASVPPISNPPFYLVHSDSRSRGRRFDVSLALEQAPTPGWVGDMPGTIEECNITRGRLLCYNVMYVAHY